MTMAVRERGQSDGVTERREKRIGQMGQMGSCWGAFFEPHRFVKKSRSRVCVQFCNKSRVDVVMVVMVVMEKKEARKKL